MNSKRISLQLRNRAAADITRPTPSQQHSQDNHNQETTASAIKVRPSRLRPTVPLHMTTRRHKTVLETISQPSALSAQIQPVPNATKINAADMPPKRISIVGFQAPEVDEPPKKRFRGSMSGLTNSNSPTYSEASKGTDTQMNGTKDTKDTKDTQTSQVPFKRPRGRPSNKVKAAAAALSEKNNAPPCITKPEPSINLKLSDAKPAATTIEIPNIARRKVPQKQIFEQYNKKQQLAFKHATTEQLRKRQARLQSHYSALAQLAKQNNALLVDKSIEILNNISDADLARTRWVENILAGLEKREEARLQQIEFEKKVRMINAFHTYTATKERIIEEYNNQCADARIKYLESTTEEISRLKRRYQIFDEAEEPDAVRPPPVKRHQNGIGALVTLAGLAEASRTKEPSTSAGVIASMPTKTASTQVLGFFPSIPNINLVHP